MHGLKGLRFFGNLILDTLHDLKKNRFLKKFLFAKKSFFN